MSIPPEYSIEIPSALFVENEQISINLIWEHIKSAQKTKTSRSVYDKRYYVNRRSDPEKFKRYKEQQREYSQRKRKLVKENDSEQYQKQLESAKARSRERQEIIRLMRISIN